MRKRTISNMHYLLRNDHLCYAGFLGVLFQNSIFNFKAHFTVTVKSPGGWTTMG